MVETLPYGSWPSPFTAAWASGASPRIDGARFVGAEIWWGESVPAEKGRVTVRRSSGAEVLRAPWSARSRVHEYGGGAWTADDDGTLYFVDAGDQRVYRQGPAADPLPLTPAGPSHGGLHLRQGRLFAVREDLSTAPHTRGIVEIPTDGSAAEDASAVRVIVQGDGFFAHPALSPDGTRLAWVAWDRGRMPWEGAGVQVAELDGGRPQSIRSRAALQPEWIGDAELVFADDPDGRWGLHRVTLDGVVPAGAPQPVAPADADTG